MHRTGLLATLAVALVHSASADTITVCAEGCDFTSINAAIATASDGDVIQLSAEVYQEGTQIDTLGKAITLRGAVDKNGEPTSVLDGQSSIQVLVTQTGESNATRFENLVIRNGFADRGGGMANIGTSPTVANCAFESNVASDQGGGMYNLYGSPIVESSRFLANAALMGGGTHNQDGSQAEYRDCLFTQNLASIFGGAMRNIKASPLVVNSVFDSNTSHGNSSFGGGVSSTNGPNADPNGPLAVPVFIECIFVGNSAHSNGGAIDSMAASFVVVGCTFEDNTARTGGAIRATDQHGGQDATYQIDKSLFCSNIANQGFGGAISTNSDIQISGTHFLGNGATVGGGAIFVYGSTCRISACLFESNDARVGGAIYNYLPNISPAAVELTDCEFASCCEVAPPWSFTDGGGNDYQAWCDDCRADVNCLDDAVDAADLAYMLGVWGTSDPQCDITGDGIVDGADLGALLIGWGPCP